MKNAFILFICLLFSISTFGQTTGSMGASLNGLEKYSGDGSVSDYGSAAIGSYNGYYYYTFAVFDLSSLGGIVTSVNSGTTVTVTLDGQYGYNGTNWGIFFLSDITSSTDAQQASAIAGGSGSWVADSPGTASLTVSSSSIHNNKIIVGIRTQYNQVSRHFVASATLDYSFTVTPTYAITTNSNPSNYGSTSGGGTYTSGSNITVHASANSGYVFSNWTENGSTVSTNSDYPFTVTGNRSLTANFAIIQYTITTSSNPSNGGTTSGAGTYNAGSNVTMVATPASGCSFINWSENGTVVSTNATYTFQIAANRNLVANFTAPPVNLTIGYNRGSGKIIAYTSNHPTSQNPTAPASLSDSQGATATFAPVTPGNDGAPTEGGYNLIYNDNLAPVNTSNWLFKNSSGQVNSAFNLSPAQNTPTLTADINNGSYTAQMYRICNVSITASSCEGQVPAPIQVDGSGQTTTFTTTKIEGNVISITAPTNFTLGSGYWMDYAFAYWKVDGSYYSSNPVLSNIQINQTQSFEAYYTSKINNGYKSTQYSGNTGDYITLDWGEHPNANVSYQIWRRVRHQGVTGSDVCLATLSHGTTIFVDYDYIYTSSYSDDMLWYDIRGYYSTNSTYAASDFISVFGKATPIDPSKHGNNDMAVMQVMPTEYSLGSYPNPFNPTTVIRYTMPEAGQVSLKVYNILSQEVANLVDETKSAGVHTVNFNANNLPTGIYIARLQAGSKVMSIKLQLVK